MRDILRRNRITTPAAALEIIRQSKERARLFVWVVLGAGVLVALLWPEGRLLSFSLLLFFIVWIITSARNGQRYIQRYIDEELNMRQDH